LVCKRLEEKGPLSASAAHGLSVARAGSNTVKRHLAQRNVPSYHYHECSLAAYARAGARRVVVSLRDPVARLVSGFQRRFDEHISQKRPANVLLISTFSMGLDVYVDALFDPAHAAHAAALSCTYGHLIQNYMIPVEEFYLAGMDRAAPGDADVVDVKYACISSLDADIAEVAAAWGLELVVDLKKHIGESQRSVINHSGNASDTSTTQHRFLSDANAARFRTVYAKDVELFSKFCTNRVGGVAGERFAVSSLGKREPAARPARGGNSRNLWARAADVRRRDEPACPG